MHLYAKGDAKYVPLTSVLGISIFSTFRISFTQEFPDQTIDINTF